MKNITIADKKALELAGNELTDFQKAFVDNLFTPGTTQEEAAIAAGYNPRSAGVAASRNLRLPHVIEYLDVCVNRGIKLNAVSAAMVVKDLSDASKSPYVRLQAAQDILDRAGHKPATGPTMTVGELNVHIDLT